MFLNQRINEDQIKIKIELKKRTQQIDKLILNRRLTIIPNLTVYTLLPLFIENREIFSTLPFDIILKFITLSRKCNLYVAESCFPRD